MRLVCFLAGGTAMGGTFRITRWGGGVQPRPGHRWRREYPPPRPWLTFSKPLWCLPDTSPAALRVRGVRRLGLRRHIRCDSLGATGAGDEKAARRLRPAGKYVHQHDFGVVGAGSTLRHVFVVPNEGPSRQTIRLIAKSCACTAARVSQPFIEPGGTVEIEVSYRTPKKVGDTRGHMTVLFEEADAQPAFLVLSAKVREPMTIFTDEVVIRALGMGQRAAGRFEIENFSDDDWATVAMTAGAPWAAHACKLLSRKAPSQGPRQLWEASVEADAAGLRPGRYQNGTSR